MLFAIANGRIFKFFTLKQKSHGIEEKKKTPKIHKTTGTIDRFHIDAEKNPRLESDADVINRVRYCCHHIHPYCSQSAGA